MRSPKGNTIRRSVALPEELVKEARSAAPPELRDNLNRLVVVSLQEFAARRWALAFERAMEEMGADPAIQAECQWIAEEFAGTEADGLVDVRLGGGGSTLSILTRHAEENRREGGSCW